MSMCHRCHLDLEVTWPNTNVSQAHLALWFKLAYTHGCVYPCTYKDTRDQEGVFCFSATRRYEIISIYAKQCTTFNPSDNIDSIHIRAPTLLSLPPAFPLRTDEFNNGFRERRLKEGFMHVLTEHPNTRGPSEFEILAESFDNRSWMII